jgi:hypothetical protein
MFYVETIDFSLTICRIVLSLKISFVRKKSLIFFSYLSYYVRLLVVIGTVLPSGRFI